MFYKSVKLFFFLYIFFNNLVFAQNATTINNNELIEQYNSWLTLSGLSKILVAEGKSSALSSNNGKLSINPVNHGKQLLILKPVDSSDPQKFALAWLNVKNKLKDNGIDIYSLLLNKLADLYFLPLDSVSISIITSDAEAFSLKISYDKQNEFSHAENITVNRGNNVIENIELDIKFIQDTCLDTNGPQKPQTILRLMDGFFKKYKAGEGGIKIDSIINSRNTRIKYRIANIYGVVTQTPIHEIVFLDMVIGKTSICYNVDIQYSGGEKAPNPDFYSQSYHEAAFKFREQCDTYERTLEKSLRQLLNGK